MTRWWAFWAGRHVEPADAEPDRRARVVAACAPFLETGEAVRFVFLAETGQPPSFGSRILWWWTWSALADRLSSEPRLVCVTDRAALLLAFDDVGVPDRVLARRGRVVRFALRPTTGTWAGTDAFGGRIWVHQRFHDDAAAADAALAELHDQAPPSEPGSSGRA